MHLATKAKQENETKEAVQYNVNSTSSIKDDVSEFRYINYIVVNSRINIEKNSLFLSLLQ